MTTGAGRKESLMAASAGQGMIEGAATCMCVVCVGEAINVQDTDGNAALHWGGWRLLFQHAAA